MPSISNIKSISYLKRHAAQISEDLAMNATPFVVTQNGEASMLIESVKQFQEKESLIAALKIVALGEKERMQGSGFPLPRPVRNWPQRANAASHSHLHSS